MKQKKFEKGVTLIALVVTIIVILIIAGISLSALTGQDSGLKVGEETKTEVNVDEEKNALRLAVQETMNSDSKGEINEEPFREHLDQHVKPENYDNFEYRENSKSYILQMVPTQNWYTITKDGEVLDGKVNLPMIVIDNESLNLEWEEVKQLTAVMRSDDGDEPITDAIWRSSDLSVATVDDNGLVTAQRKSGTITITVEKDGLIAECVVVVKNTVKVLELDKTEYTIDLSGEKTLQVVGKYYPEDADTGINLTYTIADTSVATVDENGLITGLKNGETELTLSNELGLSTIATVKVVTSPTGITLDRESVTTTGSFQLTATITPDTANVNTDITWSSSNSNIASVDSSGYVRRVSSGYAVITATTGNGKTAQCQVTMKSTSYSSGGGGSSSGGHYGGGSGSGGGKVEEEEKGNNNWLILAGAVVGGTVAAVASGPVLIGAAIGAVVGGVISAFTGGNKSSSSGGGSSGGGSSGGGSSGGGSSGGGGGCVADGTLITLANGEMKKVEELTGDETLLVWNMFTGEYDEATIGYIINHDGDRRINTIIHLFFSDGSDIEVVRDHGFYDIELNKYISLSKTNYKNYIGHHFLKQSFDNQLKQIQLIDVKLEKKYTGIYEVVTDKHLTCFTNGILSISSLIEGFCNIFEIDRNSVTYNEEKMNEDIEKYGLFTYEDFEQYIPEEAFELYNVQYLKVAMSKGNIKQSEINFLIDYYHKNIDKLIRKNTKAF